MAKANKGKKLIKLEEQNKQECFARQVKTRV